MFFLLVFGHHQILSFQQNLRVCPSDYSVYNGRMSTALSQAFAWQHLTGMALYVEVVAVSVKSLRGEPIVDGRARARAFPAIAWSGRRSGGRAFSTTAIQTPGSERDIGWMGFRSSMAILGLLEALALVKRAAGEDAWLEASTVSSGSTICRCSWRPTGAVAAFRRDVRQLRPNILAGSKVLARRPGPVPALDGDAIVRLYSLRARADDDSRSDTLDRDPEVLRVGRQVPRPPGLNAEWCARDDQRRRSCEVIRRQIVSSDSALPVISVS